MTNLMKFSLSLFCLSLVFVPSFASAETDVSGQIIATDTVWTMDGNPYVVHDDVTVESGATLTISAGTIVKFDNAYLDVYGRLKILGGELFPVHLTSYLDDSIAGDTNGDGDATLPSQNDRWGINISDSGELSTISNTTVSYSHDGLYLTNSSLSLQNSNIIHSRYAVTADNSHFETYSSVFDDILYDAVDAYNGTVNLIDATIKNVGYDAIGGYDNSNFVLSSTTISNIGFGSALGLYDSSALIDKSIFSDGLDSGIEIYGSASTIASSTIINSKVHDFLTSGIASYEANLHVLNSDLFYNGNAVEAYKSIVSLEQNDFENNFDFAVLNNSNVPQFQINAVSNFWGDASGPFNLASNPSGLGNAVSDNVAFKPFLTSAPNKSKKPNPVIIIPGLLGSAEKNGVWLIDPIFHVYDNLIDTLKANGYVDGVDLFTFPYDWRNSNIDTAILLRSKIASVRTLCSCNKVDLVAHSMGGLVARQYIQSPVYASDVDHLIFLATPHLGSPKAYLTWEAGESTSERSDRLLKSILSQEAKKAGYSNLFTYIHDKPIPSFQQLLPITDYIHDVGSTSLRTYPTRYPRNTFLENLNSNVSALINSGVNITNIVGDTGTSTISIVRVVPTTSSPLWIEGYPDGFSSSTSTDKGLELGRGDGTVALSSSSFLENDLRIISSVHRFIPTDGEGFIYKKLTGRDTSILINKIKIPDLKILVVKLLSPVDMYIIAPDGKRVGKDFATGNEFNEIPDAFYSGFATDDEYITIPDPLNGEYKVITQGTGAGGEYTIATGLITDIGTSEASFSGQTTPGLITPISIPVDTNTDTITIAPVDNTPPTISISSPEAKDYLRSTSTAISINATSTDTGSGVFSLGLSLNGVKVKNADIVDTYAQKLGNQTLIASSTDNVGNATSTIMLFRIIATPQSTIDDVERAFALGWIAKKDIKNDIISKLNQAIKIEKKIVLIEEKLPSKPKVIKQIEKLEARLDKVLGKAILKDLDSKHPKSVNDQAYNLLVEDINWLINN